MEGQGLPAPSHQPPGQAKAELDLSEAASRVLQSFALLAALRSLVTGNGPLARMVRARLDEVEILTAETAGLLLWPATHADRAALRAALIALSTGSGVAS
jgi:hypothetical protein